MVNIKELTGRNLSQSNRMLVKNAYDRGVEFKKLKNGKFKMSHDGKSYIVRGGRATQSPNTKLAMKIVKYKNTSSSLLRNLGFPCPQNAIFTSNEIDRAWNWAKSILPVVIKPNDGSMGKLVFVKIEDYDEFVSCFKKVSKKHSQILIEQFVSGEEYRFSFIKDEVVAVAKRVPANVVGDGKHTIEELINIKNKERDKRKNPLHKKLDTKEETVRVLKKHGLSLTDIPSLGEIIYLRSNSNISTGGDGIDMTDSINPAIKDSVTKAIRSIPGLRVCGADILINGDEYSIIEINSHAMLSMHHFPWEGEKRDVITQLVDYMFPNTVKQLDE
ncbi:ATP-grasp domain-containing protein [Pseudogracilibacillus sp. ICA-222130]|uniref:ATP-grasp domain-containing protein n=1 Tax=Pseudogracilibacillus sp. ICA-222130 TaxID=3134655 RepID=UPI0030C032C4